MRVCVEETMGLTNSEAIGIDGVPSLQPFVDAMCSVQRINRVNPTEALQFLTGSWKSFTKHNASITVAQYTDSYNKSDNGHIIWAEPPSDVSGLYSLMAIVAPPRSNDSISDYYNSCSIRAAWLDVKLSYTRNESWTEATRSFANDASVSQPSHWASLVTISPQWASTITLPKKYYHEQT